MDIGNEEIHFNEMVNLLERWTNINSHTDNLKGIDTLLSEVQEAFKRLNADQSEIVLLTHERKGLFLKKRENAPFQIFFGGHLDTVFSLDHPFQKGKRIDPMRFQGPGSTDMKGGIVILLKSLELFEQIEGRELIGWEIFLNSDEEIGSPDSTPFLETCANRCHLACIFEPRLEDGSLVSRRKGSSNFTVISRGKRAHTGRDFRAGKNAIYPLIHFLSEIEALNAPEKEVLVSLGVIKGGEATNIIPDYAECRLNVRTFELKEMERVDLQLREVAEKHGLQLVRTSYRPPKPFEKTSESYFILLQECGAKMGLPVTWKESGGVCDGNTFAAKKIPTIDTLGVRGGKIHTEEEYTDLKSLLEHTKLLLHFLLEIAHRQKGRNS